MRQRLGLVRPYVLCLATNKPHKNLAGLVAGWARCSPGARKDTELVFAGRHDAAFPETREAIAEYGVFDTVRLLGPVPDALLPALMSGATAFCFPSLYEGFGLPVLEAMACGTPVAASNRSSLPEVVGDAGLLFDPADHEAIGVALSRLISDDKLRQRLARAGLARAHEFSWERTAQATLEGYRSVLARRSVC